MAIQYLGTTISGVSGDTKPTLTSNELGVIFVETDTDKIYQWDGDSWEVTTAGDATTSAKGVASFSSDNFAVSSGAVTIKNDGVILGTETTGNYVGTITAGTGITSTGATSGEGVAHSLSVDAAQTQITSVGALNAGSITSGFTSIDVGSGAITTTGTITAGNLNVTGTTTTVNSTNTTIADRLIELASGAGSSTADAGIIIERGSTGDNAIMAWDESADRFVFGTTTATGASTGDLTITTGTLAANLVGNVTGNVTGTADTATTATVATTVTLYGSGNVTYYPTFVDSTSGNENIRVDSDWTYNASTNKMTVGNIGFADNGKIEFGDSQDLQIYHDANNSIIYENGAGNLLIGTSGGEVRITTGIGSEFLARFIKDDGVYLYDDDSTLRFNTSTTGATVTGDLTTTGNLTIAADGYIAFGDTNHLIDVNAGYMVFKMPTDEDFYWQQGSTNIMHLDTSANHLYLGQADAANGIISILGGASGNDEGGELRLFTSADHDSTYNYYFFDAYQDDLRIGRAGVIDFTLTAAGTHTWKGSGNFSYGSGGAVNGIKYFDLHNQSTTAVTDAIDLRLITRNTANNGTSAANIIKRYNGEFTINNADTHANAYMRMYVGSTTTNGIHINNSGQVGMGVIPGTTASDRLEVTGGIRIRTTGGGYLKFTDSDVSGSTNPSGLMWTENTEATMHAYINYDYDTQTTIGLQLGTSGNDPITYNSAGQHYWQNDSATRMTLDGTSLGVGTSTFAAGAGITSKRNGDNFYLEQSNADNGWIVQTLDATGYLYFERRGEGGSPSNTSFMYLDNTGNLFLTDGTLYVTAGTTNTAAKFISSDTDAYVWFLDNNTDTDYPTGIKAQGDDLYLMAGGSANHSKGIMIDDNGFVRLKGHTALGNNYLYDVGHGDSYWTNDGAMFASANVGGKVYIKSTGTNSYPSLRFINDAREWRIYGADGSQGDRFVIHDATASSNHARFVIDAHASKGKIGMGTVTPFQNVAGGTVDLDVSGLHIKDSSAHGQIILEGNPPSLHVMDLGGGSNDKWMMYRIDGGLGWFQSLNDDGSDRVDNILVMDMGTGHAGFNAVPKQDWNSSFQAIHLGDNTAFANYTDRGGYWFNNIRYNTSSQFTYIETNEACVIDLIDGHFRFRSAVSGTADANATMDTKFYIANGGQVAIGSSTPKGNAKVSTYGGIWVDPQTWQLAGSGNDSTAEVAMVLDGYGGIYSWFDGYNRNIIKSVATGIIEIGQGNTGIWNTIDLHPGNAGKVRIYGDDPSSSNEMLIATFEDANLTLAGQIKISGGSPGADKVLTSDANGLATWEEASGGGGLSWSSFVGL